MKKRFKASYLISAAVILIAAGSLDGAGITGKNLLFVNYPDFPEAHSTWGSIGYSEKYHKVFIGVTNHRDKVGLFEHDVETEKMRLLGFVQDFANLREYQWQGKIHSKLVEGPDGCIYFSTDGGESREEYLMNHPQGYSGGFFLKWDPTAERLINLGQGLQYESIKDITLDRISGLIMGVSYPQTHLLLYDPEKNNLCDLGRVGSESVPRVLWSDWWGNLYYNDWRQRIVKYERETGKLLFSPDSLPAFPGTPAQSIITGVTAFAEDQPNGVIYLVTYGSMMLAFHPQKIGIGRVEKLGGLYDGKVALPYTFWCRSLALGDNGMLYYFLGGHNHKVDGLDGTVLMEFDPDTGKKRALMNFPLEELSEATGTDVKDKKGNLYFCGRRRDPEAEQMGESGASRPFLIIFNPEIEPQ